MHFQLASSLLASCIFQVVSEAASNGAIAAATTSLSSSQYHEIHSTPTRPKFNKRRLLKLKQRKQREYHAHLQSNGNSHLSGQEADVGILTSSSHPPRFLAEDDYDYYCPRDTCPSELCDCADAGGSLEDCYSQLQSVCRSGKLPDCVYEGYVQVYQDVYCGFVNCLGEGFRQNQCDCAFYEMYCNRLNGEGCKDVVGVASDEPDKKPFFGCDETELAKTGVSSSS